MIHLCFDWFPINLVKKKEKKRGNKQIKQDFENDSCPHRSIASELKSDIRGTNAEQTVPISCFKVKKVNP